MAITRARKEELVAQYAELLNESGGFVVVQSTGLTVTQTQELRRAIYGAEGKMLRTKNTLLKIALEENGWTVPEELLSGPVSVAFGRGNFPGVAKAVLKFIKDSTLDEKIQVTGGVMDANIINPKQVQAISDLPTLDELRAQLAGLVVAPAQGIVNVLNAANSQIVNVIQAYLDDRGAGNDEDAA